MYRDPELPNGFQDADFEMRDLEEKGRRSAALRKKGICDHGWRQVGNGRNGIEIGKFKCLHCGAMVDCGKDWRASE